VIFVEFSIGSLLIIGAGLQSTYLPETVSGCDDAYSWGVQGNTTNLFRPVSGIHNNTEPKGAQDVCGDFVTVWIMAMVLGYDAESDLT
jgi:hypothetical protein